MKVAPHQICIRGRDLFQASDRVTPILIAHVGFIGLDDSNQFTQRLFLWPHHCVDPFIRVNPSLFFNLPLLFVRPQAPPELSDLFDHCPKNGAHFSCLRVVPIHASPVRRDNIRANLIQGIYDDISR